MSSSELISMAEQEIAQIIKVLPDEIRAHALNCQVSFETKPTAGTEDEDSLGVFEGASLLDEASPDNLPRIRIFVENIWEYVERDEQDYLDEVGTTFLHELGHYLGWDEDEIEERGLG
ncbi:MAG: metallopeptidase family protein [Akkermansiaceae bacterium]|jgi:predicted Zn-dependent protease with MMP-like domain|nr:metallopeptidase family protein [Luteolibacter sp.]